MGGSEPIEILKSIMENRKIEIPDWRRNQVSLPEEGFTPPEYSYTFFKDENEARKLAEATSEQIAEIIGNQPGLTSRFLHQLLSTEKTDVAKEIVQHLGGVEAMKDFVNQDCHRALCMMTFDFVPEEEIMRFITGLHNLGLQDIEVDRLNLNRVNKERFSQVQMSQPDRAELEAYARKFNQGKLIRHEQVEYTKDFRIVDPRRNLRYVGLGNTGNYDWVSISGIGGFEQNLIHYIAPDKEAKIAMLSDY